MGAAAASLFLIAFAASGEGRPNGDPAARSLGRDRMRSVVRELIGFMAIPNVATDRKNILRNAVHLAGMMRDRGIPSRILEIEGGPPLVVGEIKTPGAKKTLLIYAHYDGQPVDPTAWTDDPWKPVLRMGTIASGAKTAGLVGLSPDRSGEWRLYGRGASDDKGTIVAALAALDILKERKKPLSVNVRYLFEGEEEQGSPHLQAFLVGKPDLFRADGMILCDGPVHQTRRPMIVFGARGVVGLEMTVFGPDRPLHSGHYGNWAPNPAAILSRILGSLRADDGTVNIPGFYDDVRPLSEEERQALAAAPPVDEELRREFKLGWTEGGGVRVEERIMRPALNVRGLRSGNIGAKAQNAVPAEATASIDFRLVPDQSPARVRDSFERAVRAMGFEIVNGPLSEEQRKQAPRFIQMTWEGGYPGYREPMSSPFARALVRTLDAATGGRLVQLPASGGSIPMEMFARVLGLPIALLPIANHDNNQHGPDENIRLQNLWDGVEMHAALLADLGKNW